MRRKIATTVYLEPSQLAQLKRAGEALRRPWSEIVRDGVNLALAQVQSRSLAAPEANTSAVSASRPSVRESRTEVVEGAVGRSARAAFGDRLRAIRRANDVTQAVVARAVGVSSAYVCHIEYGQRHAPDADLVDMLLAAVGASYDEVAELRDIAFDARGGR